jgi:hypothetical protein
MGISNIAFTGGEPLVRNDLSEIVEHAALCTTEHRFLPGGRGLRFARELSLSEPDISRMLDTAENTLKIARRFGSTGTEIPRCIFDITRFKSLQISTRCSAAIHFFVIGPSGYMRVCNHSPVNLNHIDDINNLKLNDYWIRFVRKMYLPASATTAPVTGLPFLFKTFPLRSIVCAVAEYPINKKSAISTIRCG